MIWLRRLLAVFLGFLLILLMLPSLVVFRLNNTLLTPDFYNEEFRKAGIYTFLLQEMVPTFVKENWDEIPELPLGVTIDQDQVIGAMQRVVSPDWLEEQVEQSINEVVPYLTGERDTFSITIPLADRLQLAIPEVKALLADSKVYDALSSQDFVDLVDTEIAELGGLPFSLTISPKEVASSVSEVAPPEWLRQQTEQIMDEVVPYLMAEKEHFEVRINVKDRVDAAIPVLKELLRSADVYNVVLDNVVVPIIEENVGNLVELPYGITISQDEIGEAARLVLPPEWIQEQVEGTIDEVTPYLTGEQDGFRVEVPVGERVDAAFQVVEELAERKLERLVATVPRCTAEAAITQISIGFGFTLPTCMPPIFTVDQVIEELLPDLESAMQQSIREQLPDVFTYTEANLRASLEKEQAELLDDILEAVRNGYSFTDTDLRRALTTDGDTSAVDALDEVREKLSQGFIFTEVDLKEGLSVDAQAFDRLRDLVEQARGLIFLIYLALILLIIGIGFLGGRRWHSRIAWMIAFPAIAYLIVIIISGPVYDRVSEFVLDEARTEAASLVGQVETLRASKAIELGETMAEDFISGIRTQARILFAVCMAVLALSMSWPWLVRLVRRDKGGPPEPEADSRDGS